MKKNEWEKQFLEKFPFLNPELVVSAKETGDDEKAALMTAMMQNDLREVMAFIAEQRHKAREEERNKWEVSIVTLPDVYKKAVLDNVAALEAATKEE